MHYISDPARQGRAAAIKAGYPARSASSRASDLLKRPRVIRELETAQARISSRLEITTERVLQELAKMGFSNMDDFLVRGADGLPHVDLSKITRDQAAAIQEVTIDEYTEGHGNNAREVKRIRFKLVDKKGPLELLGKNLKMFVDRQQWEDPNGEAVQPGIIRVEFVDHVPEGKKD